MADLPTISPHGITQQLIARIMPFYKETLSAVYLRKVKDGKRRADALKDDAWRYDSKAWAEKALASKGLSHEDLCRLTQWKITHGSFRPQLPGLVAANQAETVEKLTIAAFEMYSEGKEKDSSACPSAALRELIKLKGVGPATASLILNVLDEDQVPFMSDELYAWMSTDGKQFKVKMKYDLKEYGVLWDAAQESKNDIKAGELERLAFVLAHAGELTQDSRKEIAEALGLYADVAVEKSDSLVISKSKRADVEVELVQSVTKGHKDLRARKRPREEVSLPQRRSKRLRERS